MNAFKEHERFIVTLASGKESLKNIGSHDNRVKKVLAVQRCVTITALRRESREKQPVTPENVELFVSNPAQF